MVFEDTKQRLLEGKNEVLGHFRCQGKVDPKLLERMKQMSGTPHQDSPERQARLAEAAKHPNAEDCMAAEAFAMDILKAVRV